MAKNIEKHSFLTNEQLKISNFELGTAYVLGCAASGKSTTIVYRIKAIIDKKLAVPEKILICSYSQNLAIKMHNSLEILNIKTALCKIIQTIGYEIIQMAYDKQYIPYSILSNVDFYKLNKNLLSKSIAQFAEQNEIQTNLLNIDIEELDTQISIWKKNLVYHNKKDKIYVKSVLKIIKQAEHIDKRFIEIYKIYNDLCEQEKIITYDDILLKSWEILIEHKDILEEFQGKYDYIMVDDFQDMSLAQYKILELLTHKHKNLMIFGDDDQNVYEFQGLSSDFLANFSSLRKAKKFILSENLRTPAPQALFANLFIKKNKSRLKKPLCVAKDFNGEIKLTTYASSYEEAKGVINEIESLAKNSINLDDIVILIRNYSQLIFFEDVLINRKIPYDLLQEKHFYQRDELVTLFKYLAWAFYEIDVQKNGFPNDETFKKRYIERFREIINTPQRNISERVINEMCNRINKNSHSITNLLSKKNTSSTNDFLSIILGLMKKINKKEKVSNILEWLVDKINYKEHLLLSNGIQEIGVSKLQAVELLISLASNKQTKGFLDYLIKISKISTKKDERSIKIMTIAQAKGLEWDYVFMPNLNNGMFPCCTNDFLINKFIGFATYKEFERRLFYIAITRAKQNIYMSFNKNQDESPLLIEFDLENLLIQYNYLNKSLENLETRFTKNDMIVIIYNTALFNLEHYFLNNKIFTKVQQSKMKKALLNIEKDIKELKNNSNSLKIKNKSNKILSYKYNSILFIQGMKLIKKILDKL